jgi:uncharacterized protein (DUF433 family)
LVLKNHLLRRNPLRPKLKLQRTKGYIVAEIFEILAWVLHPLAQNAVMREGLRCTVSLSHSAEVFMSVLKSVPMSTELLNRITSNPRQCGGRPCIRGMRIRVKDVLDMLAGGASEEEILADFPYLEPDDIRASLEYAAAQIDHAVVMVP